MRDKCRSIPKLQLATLLALSAVSLEASGADAAGPLPAISPQPLASALTEFGSATGMQIVYRTELAQRIQSRGASAGLSIRETLEQLLRDTGLRFEFINERTVAVIKSEVPPSATAPAQSNGDGPGALNTPGDGSARDELEVVVVTAQKRSEALNEVPVPVTAIRGESLISSNLLRVQDYYVRVPGMNMAPGDFHGAPQLAIRGVTTGGFSSPTVGVVIDDVPYGASLGVTMGNEAPDFDPSELERVELLRGPQGTLYGASSMGGLLKFVTVDPSTDGFSGRIQLGTNTVKNANDLGYNLRGSLNAPLGDTLAVRVSGFTRLDPGYVDNPLTGEDGLNESDVHGGRLSALWRPSDTFSLKLSALVQKIETDGSAEVYAAPGLGDLEQTALRGTGIYDKDIQVYSVTMNADLGVLDFTSISGYNISEFTDSIDYTRFRGAGAAAQFGVQGAALQNHFETERVTQEFRFTAPLGDRLDLLLGVFYNHETTDPRQQDMMAVDPASGAVVGALFYDTTPNRFEEYAAFANLTVNVTHRFDVQFGGRYAHNEQSSYQRRTITAGGGLFIPEVTTEEEPFTYLVTPRFRIAEELMVYARLASGYRPGGPNPNAQLLGLPLAFEPDKTYNYEIGVKGALFDGIVAYDASAYYIDWQDMQLQLVSSAGQGYFANASRATSQGLELAMDSKPLDGLSVTGWIAYNDATLSEPFPAGSTARGAEGDRLPVGSRVSGSLSVQQEFPLLGGAIGYVEATVSYVGDRKGVFVPGTSLRQELPAYSKTDFSGGIRWNEWSASVFVNNATDRRGLLGGGLGTIHPNAFTYIQPRTAGLSIAKSF